MSPTSPIRRTCHDRAPRLESPRLVLRAHTIDDLDAMTALWADPLVAQNVSGHRATREQSWTRLVAYRGHWALVGFGVWAIEDRSTGCYLGDVGLGDFQRGLDPSFECHPEAGEVLASCARGRGLATEALLLALAWCDTEIGCSTVCMADSQNAAALRLAERCGYRAFAEAAYQRRRVSLHRREPRADSHAADSRLACLVSGGFDE